MQKHFRMGTIGRNLQFGIHLQATSSSLYTMTAVALLEDISTRRSLILSPQLFPRQKYKNKINSLIIVNISKSVRKSGSSLITKRAFLQRSDFLRTFKEDEDEH